MDKTNKRRNDEMSDKTQVVATAFTKSGALGKLVIGFIIFAFMSFIFTGWSNIQNNKMYGALVTLANNQEKVDKIKGNVKTAYDTTEDYFNDDLMKALGMTLAENNIQFPQELNEAIQKYRKNFGKIKDSLIIINGNH